MTTNNKRLSSLLIVLYFLVLLVLVISSSLVPAEARKHHSKKIKTKHRHNKHHKNKNRNGTAAAPFPSPDFPSPAAPPRSPAGGQSSIFNIMSFGAKGDGNFDDSNALVAAWKAACKVEGATIEIPSDFKFLIKAINLQGPCTSHLVLQIDGHVLAPPKVGSWPNSSLFQWLNFKWLHNFTIQGSGTVDGQGFDWWAPSQVYNTRKRSRHIPYIKPTALRFYSSFNVTVRNIKIINSPQCHLKFDSSGNIEVLNITILSPETSPNTDGIHLQNTNDVEIHDSNIGSGDDCVSIQTGCSNVHVHHIRCGPGHGVSIGGLGKDKSMACVSNIIVDNISIQDTLYGVRIKTWQGGIGSVKNVSFSNIQVWNVKIPIMIDQFYCDKMIGSCKNRMGAIAISGIKYDQVIGTYSQQPIHLACSHEIPCVDVDLIDIQLKPSSSSREFQHAEQALCMNSYGRSQAPLVPSSIGYCLGRGSRISSDSGGVVESISRAHANSLC